MPATTDPYPLPWISGPPPEDDPRAAPGCEVVAEVSTASGMSRQLLDVVLDLPGLATEDGGGVLSREDGGRIEAESPDPIPPESIVRWVPLDRMET